MVIHCLREQVVAQIGRVLAIFLLPVGVNREQALGHDRRAAGVGCRLDEGDIEAELAAAACGSGACCASADDDQVGLLGFFDVVAIFRLVVAKRRFALRVSCARRRVVRLRRSGFAAGACGAAACENASACERGARCACETQEASAIHGSVHFPSCCSFGPNPVGAIYAESGAERLSSLRSIMPGEGISTRLVDIALWGIDAIFRGR